jgi:hypothetical protein
MVKAFTNSFEGGEKWDKWWQELAQQGKR